VHCVGRQDACSSLNNDEVQISSDEINTSRSADDTTLRQLPESARVVVVVIVVVVYLHDMTANIITREISQKIMQTISLKKLKTYR